MPILGPINRSGRWPAISEPAVTSIEDVESRAWEIRQSVIERAMNDQLAKGDQEIWDATMKDVKKGRTIGPLEDKDVAEIVGSEQWICAYRFGVEQSNKIRGCDDYCRNEGNSTSPRSEKLVCSSTNELIARIKLLQKLSTDKMELFGWILDEADAYRQIPV